MRFAIRLHCRPVRYVLLSQRLDAMLLPSWEYGVTVTVSSGSVVSPERRQSGSVL